MQSLLSSEETLTTNNFASINRLPETMTQRNNSKEHYSKRTRTLSQEKHPDHSTQQEQKAHASSAPSLRNEQKSRNPVRRCYDWVTQCCRAPQRQKASKRTKDFWKRLKERVKRYRRKKKKNGVADETSTSTAGTPKSSEAIHAKDHQSKHQTKDEKRLNGAIVEKHGKRTKSRKGRTKDGADFAKTTAGATSEKATSEEDIGSLMQEKGFPDFTKSCCYMCANAMALVGAMAATDKFHVSIQASDSFKETSDKSSDPMSYVRTVQSSVKVKMRNVGTHYSEGRRSKTPRLKLKNLKEGVSRKMPTMPTMPKMPKIPKMPKMPNMTNMKVVKKLVAQKNKARRASKPSKPPKTRTVACGADTATKHTNTPQCMTNRGAKCVREKK